MLTINPKEIEVPKLHHYLLGAVGPRPIAFASTISLDGTPNLSPFLNPNVSPNLNPNLSPNLSLSLSQIA